MDHEGTLFASIYNITAQFISAEGGPGRMYQTFKDRREAGKLLAKKLISFKGLKDTVVIALPRGGVPVAYEVAETLGLPLDVLIVRKLGAPGREEYAFGSLATGGICFLDDVIVRSLNIPDEVISRIIDRERSELQRREFLYRAGRPPIDVRDRIVIIVDDGLATGSTMRAAVKAIKKMGCKTIVVAVPVCAPSTCDELQRDVDVWCVCVYAPEPFYAVGLWYGNFEQTSDEEVVRLLSMAKADRALAQPVA